MRTSKTRQNNLVDRFRIPDSIDFLELISPFPNVKLVSDAKPISQRWRIYDSFDWRFYRRGLWFVRRASGYEIRSAEGDAVISQAAGPKPNRQLTTNDFPVGRLRDAMNDTLGPRALLLRGDVHVQERALHLINKDQKTVLRLKVHEVRAARRQRPAGALRTVVVAGVRGYDATFRQVTSLLSKQLTRETSAPLAVLLEPDGVTPLDYTSKVALQIAEADGTADASKKIFGRLNEVIKCNASLIPQDVDTEFLHDFRVSIRRTRSALTQIKNVFPEDTTRRFKREFATIGKMTNNLRDLDVLLLGREKFGDMLPAQLRGHLDPVFDELAERRDREFKVLARALKGRSYNAVISDWQKNIEAVSDDSGDAAKVLAIDSARGIIWARFKRVIEKGEKITPATPDDALHALRIECKKLRYVMEFFASLFPEQKIAGFVRQLKKLQDNLGAFNDLCVQREYFSTFLGNGSRPPIANDPKSAAAVGGLVAALYREQLETRARFSERFREFSASQNQALARELFRAAK